MPTPPYPLRGDETVNIKQDGRTYAAVPFADLVADQAARGNGGGGGNGSASSLTGAAAAQVQAIEGTTKIVKRTRKEVRLVTPDGVQSGELYLGVTTHFTGYAWARLPDVPAGGYIRAQLPGGIPVAFQFRRRLRANFQGIRGRGDWTPDAAGNGVQSQRKIGVLSNTSNYGYRYYSQVGLPSGAQNGDYLYVKPIGGGTITNAGTGLGALYPGDLVVRWNNAWVVQQGPAGTGTAADRDWWNVTADGVFDGVTYFAGDRITNFVGNLYRNYRRGRPDQGEMFLQGEFNASTGVAVSTGAAPVSPRRGDVYQVSVAGTFSGIALNVDDWLLHDGVSYFGVPTTTITTTVVNKPFWIDITGTLQDWEVRRADKNTAAYQVRLATPAQAASFVDSQDVAMIGDSMTTYARNAVLLAFADRPETAVEGYDSEGSEGIASMLEYYVLNGNQWAGRTIFAWPGTNTENDWQQTMNAHLRMRRAVAVYGSDYIPITPIGRREFTFVNGRLFGKWHEAMKVGTDTTNGLMMIVREVNRMFNGRYVDARKALIAAVAAEPARFSAPDKQAPGMTEAESAAAYGWVPLSCFRANPASVVAAVNFVGYWSDTSALPTGGVAGDYYLRSAQLGSSGPQYVGNIITNVAGTWVEDRTADRSNVAHLDSGVNSAWANKVVADAIRTEFDLHNS